MSRDGFGAKKFWGWSSTHATGRRGGNGSHLGKWRQILCGGAIRVHGCARAKPQTPPPPQKRILIVFYCYTAAMLSYIGRVWSGLRYHAHYETIHLSAIQPHPVPVLYRTAPLTRRGIDNEQANQKRRIRYRSRRHCIR